MILFYLILLIIAPQLWVEPFVGLPVDYILYPLWLMVLTAKGRIGDFLKFNKQDMFFAGMLFWIVLSAFANSRSDRTGDILFQYFKMFILYRCFILSIQSEKDLRGFIKWFLILTFAIVIEAIQHKYYSDGYGWAGQSLGWVDPSVIEAGGTGRTRWINIFDGPGVFCVLFTTALPFVLRFLDKHYSFKVKFFAVFLLVPMLLAIWTTGSRGGFLATLAIFGLWGLIRAKVSTFTIIKVGVVLVIAYALAPSHLTQIRDENKSAQNRVDVWIEGIEMVEQNPFLGIGKGNYASYTGSLIAHNSAIEVMGETGGPGFFLWIALIYMAFKSITVILKQTDDLPFRSIMNAITVTIVGYLVSAMFVTLEYETFYILLALPRAIAGYKKIEVDFNIKDFYLVCGLMFGFYLVLKIFVMIYY